MVTSRKPVREEDAPRFQTPKACLTSDRNGRPVYGIVDMPSRPQLSIDFEKAKAAANASAIEHPVCAPNGKRMEARNSLEKDWTRRQHVAEVTPQRPLSAGPLARHLLTSPDHPLSSSRLSSGGATAATKTRQTLPYSGLRRSHLGHDLVPQEEEEERQGKEGKEREEGEEETGQEEEWEEGEEAAIATAAAAALPGPQPTQELLAAKWREAQELSRRLCGEYPHGVPANVLRRYRAEDELRMRLMDVPSLQALHSYKANNRAR